MSAPAPAAVFVSYASQDAAAARRICDALRAACLEVWFDQNELVGGDAWDRKIRTQIRDCALFLPLISAHTQARLEGYFRLEWKLAEDRSHLMAKGKPFLVPVVLDATSERDAHVPDAFLAVQWTRLPGGETSPAFVAHVQRLLAGSAPPATRTPAPALSATTPTPSASSASTAAPIAVAPTDLSSTAAPAAPRRTSRLPWIVAFAAAGLSLAAYLALRTTPASAPNPAIASPSPAAAADANPTPPTPPTATNDKSLVVLPLENLSPDPNNAFFTDGMHAEIISTLSRIPDLKVISRDSALALKASTASLAEKAAKVAVANVVTGSVRREGTRAIVVLELRRARDEAVLWSQRYDKQLGAGLLAIQTDIAEQVARTLQARERKGAFAGAQFMTANPEAYDLFLKASQIHYTERSRGGREKVLAALERALELDPNFSSAARLIVYANVQGYISSTDPERRFRYAQDAKRWAETARRLQRDGFSADVLAAYHGFIDPDNARALELGRLAAQALPNDASVQSQLGNALSLAGRGSEALAVYRQAIALDPLNRIFRGNLFAELARLRREREFAEAEADYLAVAGSDAASRVPFSSRFALAGTIPSGHGSDSLFALRMARRDSEALAVIEADLSETTLGRLTRWRRWIEKCDSLRRLHRHVDAAAAAQEAKKLMEALNAEPSFDPSERDGRLAVTLARLGRAEDAIAAGRRYVAARSPTNQVRSRWNREIELAQIYAYLARPRECVELLAKLLRVPCGLTVPMLKVDPTWDPVRDDPAFQALLADPKNSAPL